MHVILTMCVLHFFPLKTTHSSVTGVADGVGGWRNYGIDPSAFSSSLMRECERLVNNGRYKPHLPADIIQDSYQELLNLKYPLLGLYFFNTIVVCLNSLPNNKIFEWARKEKVSQTSLEIYCQIDKAEQLLNCLINLHFYFHEKCLNWQY